MQNFYNQFINLDTFDTRIINFLKNNTSAEANRIWKLLKYSDEKALFKPDLSQKEKESLIYKTESDKQTTKRIFNFPYTEDTFEDRCSIIRIYVDSIDSINHINSIVNIGIQIISHNKINNIYNDNADTTEGGRVLEDKNHIDIKSRITVLLQSLLYLLNGANIDGLGTLQFNAKLSKRDNAELDLYNNRNFFGYKLILSSQISCVGESHSGFEVDNF